MEQLEGRDILRPVFIPTGYDEITLENIVCRVFVYLLSMFNLELTPKASRVKLLSWWDLWGFHVVLTVLSIIDFPNNKFTLSQNKNKIIM